MEVEISKDKNSYMLWVRVPKDPAYVAPALRFLNSVGSVPATKAERDIVDEMKNACYEKTQR